MKTRTTSRGQTTLDFAIAMGVFLLTVAFVFTFVPSLTAPFLEGNQEHASVSDRVSSDLAEGSLADPNRPYVLDLACTSAFFEPHNDSSVDHCGYTNDTPDYRQRIGVGDRPNVNVTIERLNTTTDDRTALCDDNGTVVEASDCDTTDDDVVAFRVGDDPDHAGSLTVARRVVTVDGWDAALFVRVW